MITTIQGYSLIGAGYGLGNMPSKIETITNTDSTFGIVWRGVEGRYMLPVPLFSLPIQDLLLPFYSEGEYKRAATTS